MDAEDKLKNIRKGKSIIKKPIITPPRKLLKKKKTKVNEEISNLEHMRRRGRGTRRPIINDNAKNRKKEIEKNQDYAKLRYDNPSLRRGGSIKDSYNSNKTTPTTRHLPAINRRQQRELKKEKEQNYLLNLVDDVMNNKTSIEIKLSETLPVLSFIMPWFRAGDLGWLPLEALCRQINIDFSWELIIMEEELENPFGLENLKTYATRLKEVGCNKITYISLGDWIPLSCKWYYLIKQCDNNSKIVAMNSHDIYFPPNRLHKQYYKLINSNYNWYKTAGNIVYDIETNTHVGYAYTHSDRGDTLLTTAKKSLLDKMPLFYKKKGIDGERYKHLKPYLNYYYDTEEKWKNKIVNVNGLNNLTLGRSIRITNIKPPFFSLSTKLSDHLPSDIASKLENSIKYLQMHKELIENSPIKLHSTKTKKIKNHQTKNKIKMKKGLYNIIEENVKIDPDVEIGNYNHIKAGTVIKKGTIIGDYNDIGNNVIINENCIIQGKVRIGNGCVLKDEVTLKIGVILTQGVLLERNSFMGPNSIALGSSAYRETAHGTVIGDNTYIGAGAKLNPNIKITSHVIVGANAFVKDNITEGHVIYGGTPAKCIGNLVF